MTESPILQQAQGATPVTLEFLRKIVEFESPSSEKQAVDRLVDFLDEQIRQRGGSVERIAQSEFGDLLVARWPGNDRKPLFVMTHIDTVWPVGTLDRIPCEIDDSKGADRASTT